MPAHAYTTPPDVADTKYVKAVDTLGELHIMVGDVDGKFRPKDNIKRSEFATIAVRLSGLEATVVAGQATKFPDVPAEHWASGYINLAVEKGYLKGDVEGTFRPDSNISFAEVATILLRFIDTEKEQEAISNGGYPAGYMTVAESLGLFADLGGYNAKTPAIRGAAAIMIYNSLDK